MSNPRRQICCDDTVILPVWRDVYNVAEVRRNLFSVDHHQACLWINLAQVRANYRRLARSFPIGSVWYAVKANPEPEVLALLKSLGAGFDVASLAEASSCLAAGADPERISFGNTIKRPSEIESAFHNGITLFTFDCEEELEKIRRHAPGARVVCRVLVPDEGAVWRLNHKFGCPPDEAIRLLSRAMKLGLNPHGLTFHVGSQQTRIESWKKGIEATASVFRVLAEIGVRLRMLNLGGGIPVTYTERVPTIESIQYTISKHIGSAFAGHMSPEIVLEPGRAVVATAGVIRSEVLLRSSRADGHRWVYLDVGRFNGLPETAGGATRYPVVLERPDERENQPVVLAGPTCDGDDVLYGVTDGYRLPSDVVAGDRVMVLGAGAYTASYSSVGFNGIAPIAVRCGEFGRWIVDAEVPP